MCINVTLYYSEMVEIAAFTVCGQKSKNEALQVSSLKADEEQFAEYDDPGFEIKCSLTQLIDIKY